FMTTPMKFLLCAVLTACLALTSPVTSPAAESVVLPPHNFAEGLPGWTTAGQAEFALDREQVHDGFTAARITIAPDVTPSYQQIQWRFSDVAPDDELQGAVWIKTRGVTKMPGAYMALEYLDEAWHRVGVDHGTGHVLDSPDWQRIKLDGFAPPGAKSARLNLILHANGTAWFAAPELKHIRHTEGQEIAFQEITVDTQAVASGQFLGFGAEWDSRGYTEAALTDDEFALVRKRIAWMRLPIVRIMMQAKWCYQGNDQYDWNSPHLQSLYRHLDLCQSRGMSVLLTDWGVEPQWLQAPGIRDVGDPKYAEVIGTYLTHLIERKGYTCIKYFILVNEPNLEVKDWNRWKQGVENVFGVLKKRGLNQKVRFMGSDQSNGDAWHTMAVDQLQGILGAYDIHRYASERHVRAGRIYDYCRDSWRYALEKDVNAGHKPLVVSEAGVTVPGASSSQNPLTASYDYGLLMVDYAVQAVQAGSWAVLAWMLDDNSHAGFTWGMWKSKKDGFALKPWFYTWSLLCRTVPPGSKLYRVEAANPKLRVLAAQLPPVPAASGWTFCVVNSGQNAATVKLKVPQGQTTLMSRYLYSRTASAADADGFPVPVSRDKIDLAQGVEITCPPDAVVFLTAAK
ncbi:MAG: glycoside hydrolase family 5 protein, partial [Armatimonadota bacterium]|nr:glycoside hydrolase family 5 protein [Armatimonadota bacterium]